MDKRGITISVHIPFICFTCKLGMGTNCENGGLSLFMGSYTTNFHKPPLLLNWFVLYDVLGGDLRSSLPPFCWGSSQRMKLGRNLRSPPPSFLLVVAPQGQQNGGGGIWDLLSPTFCWQRFPKASRIEGGGRCCKRHSKGTFPSNGFCKPHCTQVQAASSPRSEWTRCLDFTCPWYGLQKPFKGNIYPWLTNWVMFVVKLGSWQGLCPSLLWTRCVVCLVYWLWSCIVEF